MTTNVPASTRNSEDDRPLEDAVFGVTANRRPRPPVNIVAMARRKIGICAT